MCVCIFFIFFYYKRLLQVTPDLPEVQKLHGKNIETNTIIEFETSTTCMHVCMCVCV